MASLHVLREADAGTTGNVCRGDGSRLVQGEHRSSLGRQGAAGESVCTTVPVVFHPFELAEQTEIQSLGWL